MNKHSRTDKVSGWNAGRHAFEFTIFVTFFNKFFLNLK